MKKDHLENGHFIVRPLGMFRSVSTTLEHDQIGRGQQDGASAFLALELSRRVW